MSITDVLALLFIAYVILVFIKVMLMLPSAYIAVAVHARYVAKRGGGVEVSIPGVWLCVLASIVVSAFAGALRNLITEGPGFFVMYQKRQVMRETYNSCQMIYPF